MIAGDILIIKHPQTGLEYEAKVTWVMGNNMVRCEWINGPEDGDQVFAEVKE